MVFPLYSLSSFFLFLSPFSSAWFLFFLPFLLSFLLSSFFFLSALFSLSFSKRRKINFQRENDFFCFRFTLFPSFLLSFGFLCFFFLVFFFQDILDVLIDVHCVSDIYPKIKRKDMRNIFIQLRNQNFKKKKQAKQVTPTVTLGKLLFCFLN